MLVTLNKANFSVQKILLKFSKILASGECWSPYIRLTFHHDKTLMTSNAYLYARLPPPFIFSFKDMACHVFTQEMSTFNKYF